MKDAIRRVAKAAKSTGKKWGMPALDPTHAREFLDLGANILAYGTDLIVLKSGYEVMQSQFAELGFDFDNRLKGGGGTHV